jgi:hypothetical protein
VRYLTLAEALIVAEAVTGIDAVVLARASRVELLDSALHAPQAGFGDEEFYPESSTRRRFLLSALPGTTPSRMGTSASPGKP